MQIEHSYITPTTYSTLITGFHIFWQEKPSSNLSFSSNRDDDVLTIQSWHWEGLKGEVQAIGLENPAGNTAAHLHSLLVFFPPCSFMITGASVGNGKWGATAAADVYMFQQTASGKFKHLGWKTQLPRLLLFFIDNWAGGAWITKFAFLLSSMDHQPPC